MDFHDQKDEWIGNETTGKQVRDGYKALKYDLHIAMEIQYGFRDNTGKLHHPERKYAKVFKNAFWGLEEETNRQKGKPLLADVSYQGILTELKTPWKRNGVPAALVLQEIVKEEADKK